MAYNLQVASQLSSTAQAVTDGTNNSVMSLATGSVGIGTTNPGDKVEITSGNLALTQSDNYPAMQLLNYSHDNVNVGYDAYYRSGWKSGNSGSNFLVGKANGKLRFIYASGVSQGSSISAWSSSDNNNAMVIDSSGNVGIGTTAPGAKLQVSGQAMFSNGTNAPLNLLILTADPASPSNGDMWLRLVTSNSTYFLKIQTANGIKAVQLS